MSRFADALTKSVGHTSSQKNVNVVPIRNIDTEVIIGMIIRYGLQNRTHKTPADVRCSIDSYLYWWNR